MKIISGILIGISLLVLAGGVCHAAGSNTLTVSAVVISKSNCKFNTATSTLNFGNLDPLSSADVTASTTTAFRCVGSSPIATFFISQDFGAHKTGPGGNRMINTTYPVPPAYLPYSLTLNPSSGTVPKNSTQTLTITGTVLASDFQSAYVGNYSDTVILTIAP